jgi:hypothetical protein
VHSGVSVGGNHASVVRQAKVATRSRPRTRWAARHRVAKQRRDDAERIRILRVKKLVFLEAGMLRQRAADLEREVEEEEAGLIGKMCRQS